MRGYPTTFLGLFDAPSSGRPVITDIEIPIIQRDYVQGRRDSETSLIRSRFLDTLVTAITSDSHVALDFIYGDVRSGVLRPLDGQQRLTTLYLLHWYVASRAHMLDTSAPWLRFSYATRASARNFTAALAKHSFPGGKESPSEWITDQPWYVYPWRQDPTIAAMLVTLDAIHDRLADRQGEYETIWQRLECRSTDSEPGAIWFLFLPVEDLEHGEDLYIKMNSRGKPLTPFEVFKADFEAIIKGADPSSYRHLADSFDGAWTDLLWKYEKQYGGDRTVDDEFMRYLLFIVEICEWRDGTPDRKWSDKDARILLPLEERARLALADPGNNFALKNRKFFFHAFDTWVGCDPAVEFNKLFTTISSQEEDALPLFSSSPDLLGAGLARYGNDFSAQDTLLLFGVLLARQAGDSLSPAEVRRRLRSLRNITAAFLNRDRYMTDYVAATEKLILEGIGEGLAGFSEQWVADEALKWTRLDEYPGLTKTIHQLEDNPLTRGRIQAFDLDAERLPSRARAFSEVSDRSLRDLLCATLLTKGDYSRDIKWEGTIRQLGNAQKDDSWMDLLTTGKREDLSYIREPLTALLDDYSSRAAAGSPSGKPTLDAIRTEWLAERESGSYFDWRYYLVRYEGARSTVGDGYFHNREYDPALGGFNYQHLRILYGGSYVSPFTDALLRAAWIAGGLKEKVHEPRWYREDDPGLTLRASGVVIRSREGGFSVEVPAGDPETAASLRQVHDQSALADSGIVPVSQVFNGKRQIDAEDRVQVCIRLVNKLVNAGL